MAELEDIGIFDIDHGIMEVYELEEEENAGEFVVEAVQDAESNEGEGEILVDEREANFNFINEQRAKSTVQKTDRDVKRFTEYLKQKNEGKEVKMEEFQPRELDEYMSTYLRQLKRIDGLEYEPDSITAVYGSFDRYLREMNYSESIMEGASFKSTREMLEAKRKFLKASGKGNKPNKAEPLTDNELKKLWNDGGFGVNGPEELLAATWYLLSLHFGLRGNHEMRQLRQGDIELRVDEEGCKFLEFTERLSKTRQGASTSGSRAFSPKAWASTWRQQCPVYIYEQYNIRKPVRMLQPESPFLLSVNHRRTAENPVWYACAAMGHNEIGKIMLKAGIRCGITRRLTNHTVRKTSITTLVDEGISHITVAQHSGHKNPESIRHYSVPSVDEQKKMSMILNKRQSATGASKQEMDMGCEQLDPDLVQSAIEMQRKVLVECGLKRIRKLRASQKASSGNHDYCKRPRTSASYLPNDPLSCEMDSEDEIEPTLPYSSGKPVRKEDEIPTQAYEYGEGKDVVDSSPEFDIPCTQLVRAKPKEWSTKDVVDSSPEFDIPCSQLVRAKPSKCSTKPDPKDLMKGMFHGARVERNVFKINIQL